MRLVLLGNVDLNSKYLRLIGLCLCCQTTIEVFMSKFKMYIFLALAFTLFSGSVMSQAKPATQAKPAQGQDIETGIDQMFKAMDRDGNKQLSYAEFKAAVVNERKQMMVIERLRSEFIQLDKNKNSTLDAAEFNAHPGLKSLPAPKPQLVEFDRNKDQKMEFGEYVNFIEQMSKRAAPKK